MPRKSRMNRAWSDDEDTNYDVADKRRRERERRNGRRNTHRQLDNSVFVRDAKEVESFTKEMDSFAKEMDSFAKEMDSFADEMISFAKEMQSSQQKAPL